MDLVYKNNLTKEEEDAGFTVKSVKNPESYVNSPTTINAVVFDLSSNERIIKVAGINTEFAYSHQKFGKWANIDPTLVEPEWLPVHDPESDFIIAKNKPNLNNPNSPKIIDSIPTQEQY